MGILSDIGSEESYTRWVVTFVGGMPLDEQVGMGASYATEDEARAAFASERLKHQRDMMIVRVDATVTVVHNGDHITFEDAYGD